MKLTQIFSCIALAGIASLLPAQSVTFNESTTVQQHPKKAGINLQVPAYYGANELYKNLLWLNPGFEPTLARQKLVASTANGGSSTTAFIPELFSASNANPYGPYNAPDLVASNYWAGATFWLARSGSATTQAKVTVCSGTVASNTAGTAASPPQYTFATPCSTAVQPGDILVLRRLAPCAADDITLGHAGWWLPVGASANVLRTDCATPYEGKQSLVLDASVAGSKSEVDSYIDDSSSSTNGILFKGQYTISGFYKTYSGTNPTLTVAVDRKLPAGSPGNPVHWPGTQCTNNGIFTATSAWTAFSMTCTGSETSDLVPSMLKIAFTASGGAVDIDSVAFSKSAGTDPTNTTVFRDEVVATLKAHCAGASLTSSGVPCEIRNSGLADADEIDNMAKALHLRSPVTLGFDYGSYNRVSLEEFLELCAAVGAEPYVTLPETITIFDAPHWVEYLYGASTTPYGALRQANGQTSPWGNVFKTIHLAMGNENWNAYTLAGANLLPDLTNSTVTPWAGQDPFFDYATDTAGIWNAMRSAPSWPAGGTPVDLVLNFQEHGWAGWTNLAMSRTGATSGELGAYTQAGVNSVGSLNALWQPLMYEVVAKTTNPAMSFYQMMHGVNWWPGILASGKVNIYEFDNGTVDASPNLTQNVLDSFTVAAGYGTATALQALSNLAAGIVDQNFNGLSEYIGYPPVYKAYYPVTGSSATANIVSLASGNSFSAGDYACFSGLVNASFLNGKCAKVLPSGLSSSYFQISFATANLNYGAENGAGAVSSLYAHHWGAVIDMGGSTTAPGSSTGATLIRPQELGLRMINAAIIGPMYACAVANPTTAVIDPNNANGSEATPTWVGYWTPPPPNGTPVPQEYAFCFMQGQRRSMVLINTDAMNAHPISFSGSGAPAGQVIVTRYAPANISQTNEAPGTDIVTNYQPSVVIGQPVAVGTPAGDTLPPFSITRYDWSTEIVPTTVVLSSSVSSPATVGSPIVLTATISGSQAVGTVTFLDGGTSVSTALPITSGVATFTTGGVSVGMHNFTAVFNGASGYADSVSNTVPIAANLIATATTLTASSTSIPIGQGVTLTAAIMGSPVGGTMTFLDNGVFVGAQNVQGSTVQFTLTPLSSGLHNFTASYDGSDAFQASSSSSVQVVGSYNLDLSTFYTRYAIGNAGTPNGGAGVGITDWFGESFDAATLGPNVSYSGLTFKLGPVGQPDVTENIDNGPFPSGTYANLYLIGTSVYNTYRNVPLTVYYTDYSSSSYVVNLSEWTSPQSYAGETVVASPSHQLSASGSIVNTPAYLYGYTLPLVPGKTISQIRFQPWGQFIIFAAGLGGVPGTSTTTSINVSSASVAAGSNVTVSASVTGGTHSGTMTFTDLNSCDWNTALLGSMPISNGAASATLSAITPCTHYLTATYLDSSTAYAPSSASATVTTK